MERSPVGRDFRLKNMAGEPLVRVLAQAMGCVRYAPLYGGQPCRALDTIVTQDAWDDLQPVEVHL